VFDQPLFDELKRYALYCFPAEACGLVIYGRGFVPFPNVHEDQTKAFRLPSDAWPVNERVLAVFHSHASIPDSPSAADMVGQNETRVPWILCATDGVQVTEPWWWGPGLSIPPLVGRHFRHGPTGSDGKGDCYSLIRDWYVVERGVELPMGPRDAEWWKAGGDLYRENFGPAGFTRIDGDPELGDVLLGQIRSPVPNHGAVYLGGGLMLHHLEQRLSAREPIGGWRKYLTHVIRYTRAS